MFQVKFEFFFFFLKATQQISWFSTTVEDLYQVPAMRQHPFHLMQRQIAEIWLDSLYRSSTGHILGAYRQQRKFDAFCFNKEGSCTTHLLSGKQFQSYHPFAPLKVVPLYMSWTTEASATSHNNCFNKIHFWVLICNSVRFDITRGLPNENLQVLSFLIIP